MCRAQHSEAKINKQEFIMQILYVYLHIMYVCSYVRR